MVGKLITLPLRVSLRSAQFLTGVAAGTARRVISIAAPSPERYAEPADPAHAPPRPPDDAPPAPRRGPARQRRPAVAPPRPRPQQPVVEESPMDEPAHVSSEPELVRESAEPGAEEGAGAGVSVAEPWTGYGAMNAKDVIDRARTANAAELAAVRLYESRHRSRQTVLDTVDRLLKMATGGLPA